MRIYTILATAIVAVAAQQASAWDTPVYSSRSQRLIEILRHLSAQPHSVRHTQFREIERVSPRHDAVHHHIDAAASRARSAPFADPRRVQPFHGRHVDRLASSNRISIGFGNSLGHFGQIPSSGFGAVGVHRSGRHDHNFVARRHVFDPAPPGPRHRPGDIVTCPVPIYSRVKVDDCDEIAPGAVPIVVAVRNPQPRFGPHCVYVRVFAPACPPRRVKVSDCGTRVHLDYGRYEVSIEADDGCIEIEYDD